MTKTEIFEKKQKEMPDAELVKRAENQISKLCKTGGKSITMSVPPLISDTDMILCELVNRFKSAKIKTDSEELAKYATGCIMVVFKSHLNIEMSKATAEELKDIIKKDIESEGISESEYDELMNT